MNEGSIIRLKKFQHWFNSGATSTVTCLKGKVFVMMLIGVEELDCANAETGEGYIAMVEAQGYKRIGDDQPEEEEVNTPYDKGYTALMEGLEIEANPYDQINQKPDYVSWRDGWIDANNERGGEDEDHA